MMRTMTKNEGGGKYAICAIGRMENRYAHEWVGYHLALGFDHIYIYDNNRDGEERFEEVLQDFINAGRVSIIDYRNKKHAQIPAYNEFYLCYGKQYDWIAYFDFDEFLVLEQPLNDFLREFCHADCLLVNWRVMTDSGLVHYDGRPMRERFTVPLGDDVLMRGKHKYNDHVKSIVRGHLSEMAFQNQPHVPKGPKVYCTVNGNVVEPYPFQSCNHAKARIDHYLTKTLEEWLTVKYVRGYPCGITKQWREEMAIKQFFEINERTKEKEKMLKEWMKKMGLMG